MKVELTYKDFHFAEQENTNWCWAAAIQNVFKYLGIETTQQQIVANSIGQIENWFSPNKGATDDLLASFLNTCNILYLEKNSNVISLKHVEIVPKIIISEIKNNRPLLFIFENTDSRHAVILIGIEYSIENNNQIIDIYKFFDPWPNRNFIEYSNAIVQTKTKAYWTFRKQK